MKDPKKQEPLDYNAWLAGAKHIVHSCPNCDTVDKKKRELTGRPLRTENPADGTLCARCGQWFGERIRSRGKQAAMDRFSRWSDDKEKGPEFWMNFAWKTVKFIAILFILKYLTEDMLDYLKGEF